MGLIGATATGMVGDYLLTLMTDSGYKITAFYRSQQDRLIEGVEWRQLPEPNPAKTSYKSPHTIEHWISTAPISALPDYFGLVKAHHAKHIVALSSTSRFTKIDSIDCKEKALARELTQGEKLLEDWCKVNGINWVILRPTLIYDLGRDKNITEIAKFIRRFGSFSSIWTNPRLASVCTSA